jgi:hypothetical protein
MENNMRCRKIIKGLFLLAAIFTISMTLHKNAYAEKNFTVTPSKVEAEAKRIHKTFYNKYVAHYVGLNSYLERMQEAGGGTLTIKKGTYNITNSIYVPSNVTIIFEDGVVFNKTMKTGKSDLQATTAMWQLCPRDKSKKSSSIGKYKGTKNVKFIAKGKVTFDMKGVKGVTIIAAHNKNIEISGITFKGMNGGHYLEVNGTKKAYIHDCTFKKAKKSTLNEYYMKEAINIDLADKKTGGLSAVWVKQDKTPCYNIRVENNVFDGTTRGVGSHKYSQDNNGKNIYHKKIVIKNNTFKNIYDNGVFVLNWKDTTIKGNTFKNIGKTSKKTYSSGSHAISGGGIKKITITGNTFKDIERNPVYFISQRNVGGGSEYKRVKVSITKKETEAMLDNVAVNCGDDENPNYAGYEILYFRNDSTKSRENGVGINLRDSQIFYGIPKNK